MSGVAQADAAVRDAARDELGLAGPVDPDVAAGRPVGQRRGLRAGAEGDGSVEGAGEAPQAIADVEVAGRSGGGGAPDPDRGAEHGAAVAQQGQGQAGAIDDQPRVDLRVAGECRARQPSGLRPARGQARVDPQSAACVARAPEHEHEVRRALRRVRRQPGDGARARRRRRARDRRASQGRPLHGMGVGAQWLRRADRQASARRRGDVGHRGARAAGLPLRAAAGERRDGERGAGRGDQPVNLGPLLLVLRMTKCVRATMRAAVAPEIGSSNGPATGGLCASRRIHAAWRASTEWMASAEAR